MWRVRAFLFLACLGIVAAKLPSLKDDTTCSIPEAQHPSCRIESYRIKQHNRAIYRMQCLHFATSYPKSYRIKQHNRIQ